MLHFVLTSLRTCIFIRCFMYPFWNLILQVQFRAILRHPHHLSSSWTDPNLNLLPFSILKSCAMIDSLGYTPNYRTWEPTANLSNAAELVTAFYRQYPCKPGPNTNLTTRETCRRRRGDSVMMTLTL